MTLGKRIKRARIRLDIPQRAVAEACGVSPQAVSNWERDIDPPESDRFPALRNVLKVTYKWLHEGGGDPPAPDDPAVMLDGLDEAGRAAVAAYMIVLQRQGGKAA